MTYEQWADGYAKEETEKTLEEFAVEVGHDPKHVSRIRESLRAHIERKKSTLKPEGLNPRRGCE